MPPSANMVSGKISVCATPAFVATFSATLPGTARRLRREGVQAARPVVGVDLGGDATLGDQQRAEDADQQQRALQEQRGLVDGDGADDGGLTHRRAEFDPTP